MSATRSCPSVSSLRIRTDDYTRRLRPRGTVPNRSYSCLGGQRFNKRWRSQTGSRRTDTAELIEVCSTWVAYSSSSAAHENSRQESQQALGRLSPQLLLKLTQGTLRCSLVFRSGAVSCAVSFSRHSVDLRPRCYDTDAQDIA